MKTGRRAIRQKKKWDKDKDRDELQRLERLYGTNCSCKEKGILKDLKTQFGITNPSMDLLQLIGGILAEATGINFGREERRRKKLAIGWMNTHYETFAPHIPNLVLDPGAGEVGPRSQDWEQYRRENPEDKCIRFLGGTLKPDSTG
jgi:hypothetical protein